MAIFNLGSINIDHVYTVRHLPQGGETLAADGLKTGLGGKGTNQSVAAARAGSKVYHIGAVGADGDWARQLLADYGVDVTHVATSSVPTGHAIIYVDPAAENVIVLFPGANEAFAEADVSRALAQARPGDTLLIQNETAHQVLAARTAQAMGIKVVYSAAPFSANAVKAILPYITTLAVNEVEAAQLSAALETNIEDLDVPEILITRGKSGAEWRAKDGRIVTVDSFPVTPVDTTAAGDTFAGYFVATRDQGGTVAQAMHIASAAGALTVTRAGAAEAIPDRVEVDAFLNSAAGGVAG